MDYAFIDILLGIILGVAVFVFLYALLLVTPILKEAIRKKKFF